MSGRWVHRAEANDLAENPTNRSARGIILPKALVGYVLFAAGIGVLFTLGYWQLIRGLEKADIATLSAVRSNTEMSLDASPAKWPPLNYQSARLVGKWLPERTFLLANRLFESRIGYEVLIPFELEGDQSLILVNRGWLPSPADGALPSVPSAVDADNVSGTLYLPGKGFTLGDTYQQPVSWPLEILYYDFAALSAALERKLQPVSLVLSPSSPHSFERIWAATNMLPSRHFGYAVQWWGLMVTLMIFGLLWRHRASRTSRPDNN